MHMDGLRMHMDGRNKKKPLKSGLFSGSFDTVKLATSFKVLV